MPATLAKDISPPPINRKASKPKYESSSTQYSIESHLSDIKETQNVHDGPSLAAIEAGEVEIRDHLEYFSQKLASVCRPAVFPQVSIEAYKALYQRNEGQAGRHFVIHQHDHPISGVHYDLRLQFSETSTISFAIPYGLPGNPDSIRPNRMAIETRVHCLWNNLIESASHATGSLLIWDTGEYEILPWKDDRQPLTDDECSEVEDESPNDGPTHSERIFHAFKDRHIRLRLHGTKLPQNYTIGLRLPSRNDRSGQPKRPNRKRRRLDPAHATKQSRAITTDSETDDEAAVDESRQEKDTGNARGDAAGDASDDDDDDEEDSTIRENNAYPGATNSIGSVHQRHWFLSLDRRRSGFVKARSGPDEGRWVGEWEPFFVYGRDSERSVVTGRSADEVMEDEGVEKFVGRKMWRPILE